LGQLKKSVGVNLRRKITVQRGKSGCFLKSKGGSRLGEGAAGKPGGRRRRWEDLRSCDPLSKKSFPGGMGGKKVRSFLSL